MGTASLGMRAALALRRAAGSARGDLVVAALAGVVQVGGTALAARHQADARTLDVYGYLLLAAGPAALIARRRRPVPVLVAAFAATLGYELRGYPGGPVWMALIVAFGTALVTGHRLAAYGSLPATGRTWWCSPTRPGWSVPAGRTERGYRGRGSAGARGWPTTRPEFGQTIAMVTHDPVAAGFADTVVVMADGRVVEGGPR